MARTPALSPDEALARCYKQYGPRSAGYAHNITAAERSHVRAWLTACGVPSDKARALSLAELRAAYIDTTDATLAALTTKEAPTMPSDNGAALPWVDTLRNRGAASVPAPAPRAPVTIDHESAAPAAAGTAAARMAQALAAMMAESPAALDEGAVRVIVADELGRANITGFDQIANMIAQAVKGAAIPSAMTIHNGTLPPVTLPALRHHLTETCIQIVSQNVPLCLVGPAGAGKTSACENVAKALSLPFYMDGAPSGSHIYLGFVDAGGRYHTTPFRQAFEHGGVYLADELDGATDPAAPLTLNAALANGVMTFPDSPEPVARHADFRMIAACNTYGTGADRVYVGRVQLDGSTLDRFAFLDFPYDLDLERALSANKDWLALVHDARKAVASLNLRHIVSTRAIVNGEKLMAAGVPDATVEALILWKGLPAADVARVRFALRGGR